MSWKDVRKNVKEKSSGPPNLDDDLLDDAGMEKAVKIKKMQIKFSWDHLYTYSSILEQDENDDDDADEEEREAYEGTCF